MKFWKNLTVYTVALLVLSASGQTAQRQKPSPTDERLEQQLPGNEEVEYLNTTGIFHRALGSIGMPGGSVSILGCEQNNAQQAWGLTNKTLRQALDTIIEADPRYRWYLADQVINLLPAAGEPRLLQTHINEFRVTNISSAMDALGPLLALPEVKKAMANLRLKPGIALFISSVSAKPFSVDFKDLTLRQALNAIALAQGRGIWDYIEVHCGDRNEVVIRF